MAEADRVHSTHHQAVTIPTDAEDRPKGKLFAMSRATRRGILQGAAALAALGAGVLPSAASQRATHAPSPLAEEFDRLQREQDAAIAVWANIRSDDPRELEAKRIVDAFDAEMERLLERIWAEPVTSWDDVVLRARIAAGESEFGPQGLAFSDRGIDERSLDKLIIGVLTLAGHRTAA
jgi:hypothetical protein